MAKKVLELDTPFRTGEKVVTTRSLRNVPEGSLGKVRLVNGLSDISGGKPWIRYWVRFGDAGLVGHVNHNDLVRPMQLEQWNLRELEREQRANQPAVEDAAEQTAPDGDSGSAGLIPAALLERSRAAKARLLG